MADPTTEGLMAGVAALEEFFASVAAVTQPSQLPKPAEMPAKNSGNGRRPRPAESGRREHELPALPLRKPRKHAGAWRW